MEIYKLPRILIITLKRFKQSKSSSRYGMMSGLNVKKIDTLVDFPLEGLDMSPYVLSEQ